MHGARTAVQRDGAIRQSATARDGAHASASAVRRARRVSAMVMMTTMYGRVGGTVGRVTA